MDFPISKRTNADRPIHHVQMSFRCCFTPLGLSPSLKCTCLQRRMHIPSIPSGKEIGHRRYVQLFETTAQSVTCLAFTSFQRPHRRPSPGRASGVLSFLRTAQGQPHLSVYTCERVYPCRSTRIFVKALTRKSTTMVQTTLPAPQRLTIASLHRVPKPRRGRSSWRRSVSVWPITAPLTPGVRGLE